jgi:hypothetical protein
MSLLDEYYDYHAGVTSTTIAKRILFEIVDDFTDRRGLRQEWETIDDDIKEEILGAWLEIIEKNLELSG